MVKTTVYLEEEAARALREMARQSGRSQAELIREALASFTEHRGRPKIVGIGAFRSGRGDLSRRTEDILAGAIHRGEWP